MTLANISKKMIVVICVLAIVASIVGVVVSVVFEIEFNVIPFIIGVFLGAAVNVIKVVMIRRVVKRATDVEKPVSVAYIQVQFFLRFFLVLIVLIAAVIFDNFINIFGVAIGIFTMPIAGYMMPLFGSKGGGESEL